MDKFVSVERSDLWIFVRLAQRSFRGAKATKTWPNYRKASVGPLISSTFHNTSTIISMHWILVWLYPKSVCLPGLPRPWPWPWQAAKITLTLHNSNFIIWCPLSPSQRVLLPRQLALGAAMCASQVSDQVRCMLKRSCDPICWCCVWCWCLCWCWCWCKPGVPPGEFYAFSKNPFYSDQVNLLHKSPVDQNHFHILQQDGEDLDPNRGQRDIEYCRGLKEEGKFRLIVVALW